MKRIIVDDNGYLAYSGKSNNRADDLLNLVGYVEVPTDPPAENYCWDGSVWKLAITESSIIDGINEYRNGLLSVGVMFDGHRYGLEQMIFVATQQGLINAGKSTTYGSALWDSDNSTHTMDDTKLTALFAAGCDYATLVNQAARTAKDGLGSLTQNDLNTYDVTTDITWPSNTYTYS